MSVAPVTPQPVMERHLASIEDAVSISCVSYLYEKKLIGKRTYQTVLLRLGIR